MLSSGALKGIRFGNSLLPPALLLLVEKEGARLGWEGGGEELAFVVTDESSTYEEMYKYLQRLKASFFPLVH